jgi:hypothetical protein
MGWMDGTEGRERWVHDEDGDEVEAETTEITEGRERGDGGKTT